MSLPGNTFQAASTGRQHGNSTVVERPRKLFLGTGARYVDSRAASSAQGVERKERPVKCVRSISEWPVCSPTCPKDGQFPPQVTIHTLIGVGGNRGNGLGRRTDCETRRAHLESGY